MNKPFMNATFGHDRISIAGALDMQHDHTRMRRAALKAPCTMAILIHRRGKRARPLRTLESYTSPSSWGGR